MLIAAAVTAAEASCKTHTSEEDREQEAGSSALDRGSACLAVPTGKRSPQPPGYHKKDIQSVLY